MPLPTDHAILTGWADIQAGPSAGSGQRTDFRNLSPATHKARRKQGPHIGEDTMNRRSVIKLAGATALTAPFGFRNATSPGCHGQDRRGRAANRRHGQRRRGHPLSELQALGARGQLDAAGSSSRAGQKQVELIEYDDRSQPGETIKAVERLAAQDKVDFIMPVYGTGYNLAAAPVFAKYGYPQVTQAAVTDQIDALIAALSDAVLRPGLDHVVCIGRRQRAQEAEGRGQDRQQRRDRERRRRVRHRARQRRPADLPAGRLRDRLRQVLSARHAGLRRR